MKKIIYYLILLLICQTTSAQKRKIEIKPKRNDDRSVSFYFNKNVPGSYYVVVEFSDLENCNASKTFKQTVKHSTGRLFTLKPYDPKSGISFSYNYSYVMGNSRAKVKDDIRYILPLKEGKMTKVFEASNIGEKYFGSDKPVDWKSFILYTKNADTVHSMRKGIVVKIVNKHKTDTSFEKSYTSKKNSITIEHKDGTYSQYKGFDKDQIFVKLGQEVYTQTPLGKLGMSDKDKYRLSFSVFHFIKGQFTREKSTLTDRKQTTKYLNPYFKTDKGLVQLNSKETYKVLFEEEDLLQEFSRKEKKKYKKKPELFR